MNTIAWIILSILATIAFFIFVNITTSVIVDAYYTRKEKHYSKLLKVLSEGLTVLTEEMKKHNV